MFVYFLWVATRGFLLDRSKVHSMSPAAITAASTAVNCNHSCGSTVHPYARRPSYLRSAAYGAPHLHVRTRAFKSCATPSPPPLILFRWLTVYFIPQWTPRFPSVLKTCCFRLLPPPPTVQQLEISLTFLEITEAVVRNRWQMHMEKNILVWRTKGRLNMWSHYQTFFS